MESKINIHETAFVTAAFRAWNTELSRDIYAYLWANEVANRHAVRYCDAVSRYEDVAHCLRNRYFLDIAHHLLEKDMVDVMINFGCGFSMYPYLLCPSLFHIEIDTEEVISYKKEKTGIWQKEGVLPEREIRFVHADFNAPSLESLYNTLLPLINNRRCFILLEGVLFFLGRRDSDKLFSLFPRLQQKGDLLGSVSFRPALEEKAVFQKLIDFVEGNLEKNQQFNYQTLSDEYYLALPHYGLRDHQDTLGLGKKYAPGTPLPKEEVLDEHMYLLEKQ